jgi:hypothetical protein
LASAALTLSVSFTTDSIQCAEKLTVRYNGRWPTFHDAEIIELRLDRGNLTGDLTNPDLVGPELTLKIQSCVESQGTHPTLVTLRFGDVEDLEISGFNHQNAILGLVIERTKDGADGTDWFLVRINPAFGLGATFRCAEIEVVEAID